MDVFKSQVKNKVLSGQNRELVANLIKFMREEATRKYFIIPVSKVTERVVAALGVSKRSVERISKEMKMVQEVQMYSFATSQEKRPNRHTKVRLDGFEKSQLRNLIINFHVTEKCVPTLKILHHKFCDEFGYLGG
ncbi:hypothetical protein JTB14_010718 [Gonioctena quinquepunctata]|nr:hypothetical protein JTB14_010718 [Gonioctena quinquepunctata]